MIEKNTHFRNPTPMTKILQDPRFACVGYVSKRIRQKCAKDWPIITRYGFNPCPAEPG